MESGIQDSLGLSYMGRPRNSSTQQSIASSILQTQFKHHCVVRIALPFKDHKSADVVRRQLGDLGTKINQQLQPVFTRKKIADHLRVTDEKPPLINQQSVVYEFICDSCDTNYIAGFHITSLKLKLQNY